MTTQHQSFNLLYIPPSCHWDFFSLRLSTNTRRAQLNLFHPLTTQVSSSHAFQTLRRRLLHGRPQRSPCRHFLSHRGTRRLGLGGPSGGSSDHLQPKLGRLSSWPTLPDVHYNPGLDCSCYANGMYYLLLGVKLTHIPRRSDFVFNDLFNGVWYTDVVRLGQYYSIYVLSIFDL